MSGKTHGLASLGGRLSQNLKRAGQRLQAPRVLQSWPSHAFLAKHHGARRGDAMNKRPRQTRGVSRFGGPFPGKESSLGPRDQEARPYAGMDWSKFKVQSLKKYAKAYELDVSNLGSKEELVSAIQRHWAQQVLNENEVLFNLGLACRKNAANAANGR